MKDNKQSSRMYKHNIVVLEIIYVFLIEFINVPMCPMNVIYEFIQKLLFSVSF